MICPQCGTQLQDGTPICPKCGARLTTTRQQPAKRPGRQLNMPEKNPAHKKAAKTIGVIVVIVVIILAIVLFAVPAVTGSNGTSGQGSSTTQISSSTDPAEAGVGSKDANTPTDDAADAAKTDSSLKAISGKDVSLTLSTKDQAAKLSFPEVAGALNYRIAYRANGDKDWNYAWTGGSTSTVVKNLHNGRAYEFKIAAYSIVNSKWVRAKYSSPKAGWLQSTSVSLKGGKKSFTATAKKQVGAKSYDLIYATSKSGLASGKVVNMKSNKTTVKGLKSKTTYYVKVRPVRSIDKTTAAGIYGATTKVKTK